LSGYLIDRGIAFNGIMLISTIMNFETTNFAQGNDIAYALFLPSYAATAWYHKKLPPDSASEACGRGRRRELNTGPATNTLWRSRKVTN
jgi:hypothetical protein